jgi:hypothetical protein
MICKFPSEGRRDEVFSKELEGRVVSECLREADHTDGVEDHGDPGVVGGAVETAEGLTEGEVADYIEGEELISGQLG